MALTTAKTNGQRYQNPKNCSWSIETKTWEELQNDEDESIRMQESGWGDEDIYYEVSSFGNLEILEGGKQPCMRQRNVNHNITRVDSWTQTEWSN